MKEGLGDKVENIINKTMPSINKNGVCNSCKKRKEWLNNFGAIFSNKKNISKNGNNNTK